MRPATNQARANGLAGVLAVAGAADTGVPAPGATPSGAEGVCGTGCAGSAAAPAAFAPAATPRPNSPPSADDIARTEFCCTAAGLAALAADTPAGLPISPDNGPTPLLAALPNGEPPVAGDGTCGNDGTCGAGELRRTWAPEIPATVSRAAVD